MEGGEEGGIPPIGLAEEKGKNPPKSWKQSKNN